MNQFCMWLEQLDSREDPDPTAERPSLMGLSQTRGRGVDPPEGQFKTFVNWYNEHRGDWREVEMAAKMSRGLGDFIAEVQKQFNAQGTLNPDFVYQGSPVKGLPRVAEIIQRNTRKRFPTHGPVTKMPVHSDPSTLPEPEFTGNNEPTRDFPAWRQDPPQAPSQLPRRHTVLPFTQSMDRRLRGINL